MHTCPSLHLQLDHLAKNEIRRLPGQLPVGAGAVRGAGSGRGAARRNILSERILAVALEDALEEALDFIGRCFLVSEQGGDLPVTDSFTTFADQELGIGTDTFCRLLDDRAAGYLSMTVWACNFSFHCSSLNKYLFNAHH